MIRPFGTLLLILIISLNLHAQDEKASRKFILGGAVFGNIESTIVDFGASPGGVSNAITVRNTRIGLSPYFLLGSHPKHKFGVGLFSEFFRTHIDADDPDNTNIRLGTVEEQIDIGLDLLYRHTFLEKDNLAFFAQASIGSGNTVVFETRSIDENTFYVQSELEFGAYYQVANDWNLIVSLPIVRYRYQKFSFESTFTSSNTNEVTLTNNLAINTTFSNLNIGIEKLF